MDLDFVTIHKHPKKKELGQYPVILTSHLVNSPYISARACCARKLLRLLSKKTLHSGIELISEFPKQCLIITKTLFAEFLIVSVCLASLQKFLKGKSDAYE